MPQPLAERYRQLESVAGYSGPWKPLTQETERLRLRLDELRERESRMDDVLIVALVGGSGVGKSTLLNALAGDELAQTSEFRPCTAIPTVYHPPGAQLDFPAEWRRVSGSALENLVLVDTPDSDTIVTEHRERVIEVLAKCDLILMCADSEKYLDEATWSLLRPLRDERTIACVETKASAAPTIREHWLARLAQEGFAVGEYFRVNSLRSLDRKIAGADAGSDEYDFASLENFLQHELGRERIARIKRSNTAGLLSKTLATLRERVGTHGDALRTLQEDVERAATEMTKDGFVLVRKRLFAQPHLWNFALGKEIGARSKGLVGTLYRLLETIRTLPARFSGWSLLPGKPRVGHRAASLLADSDLIDESLDLASGELENDYLGRQSDLSVRLATAGFDRIEGKGYEEYTKELNARITEVLRGPAREGVVTRARHLTGWPVVILSDAPPLAFFGYSAYRYVRDYFLDPLLGPSFFVNALLVFGIILVVELFLLSILARIAAWSARRAAIRDLQAALTGNSAAFGPERQAVADALQAVTVIETASEAAPGVSETR